MVLLAAAVCNKQGKVLVSRQFVEMTRARIEGLLAAFPKLMNSGKQHTFVETESVRYVYQALEQLFVVLITTKASNILEDLETLRLFARVVPEYGRSLDESAILENSFQIIFAFDEIVALGYRESVNLAQINTFIQMDSHEEKVAIALRETQEREAKQTMREKQKEFDRQRKERLRQGGNPYSNGFSGSSISSSGMGSSIISNSTPIEPSPSSYSSVPKRATGTGMKLGGKKKTVNEFVDKLASEGVTVEDITSAGNKKLTAAKAAAIPEMDKESVHIRIEEKIACVASRSGSLENLEINGTLYLLVSDSANENIAIKISDTKQVQTNTHPSIDKKMFQNQSIIALKDNSKTFPLKQEVGVVRWRLVTTDESVMPLTINCWPNVTGSGCDVNIEYELQAELELDDVVISIPLPGGVGAPRVTQCDGDYNHDSRKNLLEWTMPVIDESNRSGTIEFSIAGHEDDFFPVSVSFVSKKSFFNISAIGVKASDGRNIKFSSETVLFPDRYDIV